MSEPVIRIEQVSKAYRVFRSPRRRMLDALGFPVPRSSYDEFLAIKDISLVVHAGERVGLIGRNGAGKSTLLKIIAGLIQPSRGQFSIRGKVQALMELGTGFHPEFTGRENVMSSLAYQGVTGREASRLLDEVVDFSELDDFIDKPVKTYSAGMYARLAFAASTAIRPEVLIVDEILGAGDAYFAGKSAKRMRSLTAEGTTVLFVSHDISAVQMICDRAVWIERGHIIADGNPIEIGKSYAASIRKQEEFRLRAINLKLSRGHMSELLTDSDAERVFILRLVTPAGGAPLTPVRVRSIALLHKTEVIDQVQVGGARDDDRDQRVHVLTGAGQINWSEPKGSVDSYREFKDCGGSYGHAPMSIKVPMGVGALSEFSVLLTHDGVDAADDVLLQIFDGYEYKTLSRLTQASANATGEPISETVSIGFASEGAGPIEPTVGPSAFTYGEGSAWFETVEFIGDDGAPQHVFAFGETMTVVMKWGARQPVADMAFVVCFYGMDGRCVTQVVSPHVTATDGHRSGIVRAHFSPLMIGKGDYVVSLGLFQGMTERDATGERPLEVQDRTHRIRIVAPPTIAMERGQVVHPVSWETGGTRDG